MGLAITPRAQGPLLTRAHAQAVAAEVAVPETVDEEKASLIRDVLQLQNTLDGGFLPLSPRATLCPALSLPSLLILRNRVNFSELSTRVDHVREENDGLRKENVVRKLRHLLPFAAIEEGEVGGGRKVCMAGVHGTWKPTGTRPDLLPLVAQMLTQYIENLMASSTIFQDLSSNIHNAATPAASGPRL
jgi:hypothetical protein